MWLLTDAADWFDRQAREGEEFFDQYGTQFARDLAHDDGFWSHAKVHAVAWGYAGYKLSTTVASGYVDVLRIGDGVKKGGWGYGEDALRALVVAGPLLRAARGLSGSVRRVDIFPHIGNCTWVAIAKSLRVTGTRLFATVADLAKKAGIPARSTNGAFVHELAPILRKLGARFRLLQGKSGLVSMEQVIKTARGNPHGLVVFSVKWGSGAHSLVARSTATGVKILDRSGKTVRSLGELESLYPGIKGATIYGSAAIVADAVPVTFLENVSAIAAPLASILQQIALPVVPIVVRPVPLDIKTSGPPPSGARSSSLSPKTTPAGEARRRAAAKIRAGESGGKTSPSRRSASSKGSTLSTGSKPSSPSGASTASNAARRRFGQKLQCMSKSKSDCAVVHYYVTREGDTLSAIAQDAYGDGDDWHFIWSANLGKVRSTTTRAELLKAGMVLSIPIFF